jgi:hypothetical protein
MFFTVAALANEIGEIVATNPFFSGFAVIATISGGLSQTWRFIKKCKNKKEKREINDARPAWYKT